MFQNRPDQGRSLRQLLRHPHPTSKWFEPEPRGRPHAAWTGPRSKRSSEAVHGLRARISIRHHRSAVSVVRYRRGVSQRYRLLEGPLSIELCSPMPPASPWTELVRSRRQPFHH